MGFIAGLRLRGENGKAYCPCCSCCSPSLSLSLSIKPCTQHLINLRAVLVAFHLVQHSFVTVRPCISISTADHDLPLEIGVLEHLLRIDSVSATSSHSTVIGMKSLVDASDILPRREFELPTSGKCNVLTRMLLKVVPGNPSKQC